VTLSQKASGVLSAFWCLMCRR